MTYSKLLVRGFLPLTFGAFIYYMFSVKFIPRLLNTMNLSVDEIQSGVTVMLFLASIFFFLEAVHYYKKDKKIKVITSVFKVVMLMMATYLLHFSTELRSNVIKKGSTSNVLSEDA